MAVWALGTLMKIGDGGSPTESFTTIAEVKDISGPGFSTDTEDTTNHSSPGGWEEIIPTILRSGEVTFDVNFIPTDPTHNPTTGLIRDWVNRNKRNFQLVWPDAGDTTWQFAAYVTGFEPSAPVAGVLGASVTLKVTGQPQFL